MQLDSADGNRLDPDGGDKDIQRHQDKRGQNDTIQDISDPFQYLMGSAGFFHFFCK